MLRSLAALALLTGGCAFEGSSLDFAIDPDATQRCEERDGHLTCDFVTVTFATGAFGASAREVHLMHPASAPPAQGWPAVILFQGSSHGAHRFFEGAEGDDFGGYHQARLVRALLEAGFAVLAPDARLDGTTYWETNVLPFSLAWDTSEDHQLMTALLAAIRDGTLGPLDHGRLYAAGISSGGYMTSRMAVSYEGAFRALAIQSASYATCSGALCAVPELPADHPPTLFLHGAGDRIVPPATAQSYAGALTAQGTEARVVIDPEAGHEWLAAAPDEIVAWFAQR